MSKRSKIILVLSFVFVFAFSLSINIFADSAAYGDIELKPYFAPSFIISNEDTFVTVNSGFTNIVVADPLTNIDDTVYGTTILEDYDANQRVSRSFYLSYPDPLTDNILSLDFDDNYTYYYPQDYFMIKFYDVYYDPSLPTLADFYFSDLNFNSSFSVLLYRLDCDISYVDHGSIVETSTSFTASTLDGVLDSLDAYLYSNFSHGALVSNIILRPVDYSGSFTTISMAGSIAYVNDSFPVGSDAALIAWENQLNNTIIVNSPTVIESVTRGLNAVWDTSLFGLFTIGEVFSACAGVALFTWLLKIFNR